MPTYISPDGNPEIWAEKPQGYFTPEEWAAAHPAPPPEQPTEEEIKERRRQEILAELARLDAESVRPLRAIASGEGTEYDAKKLAELDKKAGELRAELAE